MNNKEETFNRLIAEHSGIIAKICFFYAESADEVEDMRQDTLLNLWRGWDAFRSESKVSTWIHRVCLNTCISYVRRERNHRHSVPLPELIDDSDGDGRAELWTELRRQINTLSKRERAVMLLWLEEFSYDDIAEVMGLSRNGVATLLHRIKQKLINLNSNPQ